LLLDTLDHVLANEVVAGKPVPVVDTAILDGYAIIGIPITFKLNNKTRLLSISFYHCVQTVIQNV